MRLVTGSLGLLVFGLALPAAHPPAQPQDPPPEQFGRRRAEAVPEIATKAQAVLKTHCYRCHGRDGAAEGGFNLVQDRRRLVERHYVTPKDAAKSPLLQRVAKGEMPPEEVKTRPTDDEVAILKQWVEAGAPDWSPAPERPFIPVRKVADLVRKDRDELERKSREDTPLYFTLTHLFNAGYSEDELQTVRLALARILNSTSAADKVVVPTPIDPQKTVLRVKLKDVGWTWEQWQTVTFADPFVFHISFPREQGVPDIVPVPVRADWFVFAASRPPLYHTLTNVPFTLKELETRLKVDAAANINDGKVLRSGFNGSGVSRNNRLLERHEGTHGYYWRSYDFSGSTGRQNLFQSPLGPGGDGFKHAGGEVIYRLPNGLQGYMLVNARGDRLDTAPINIVSDPKHPNRVVENGISCMNCHARGLIDKADQIRPHVEQNRAGFKRAEYDTVRALHPDRETFSKAVKADDARYLEALGKLGGPAAGTDPVVTTALRFEADVDLRQAAAEAWATVEDFTKVLTKDRDFARALGTLRNGGTVSRRTMTANFPYLVNALKHSDEYEHYPITRWPQTTHRDVQVVLPTAYERGGFRAEGAGPKSFAYVAGPQIDPTFKHVAVVAADDKTVQLYDAATGELKHTLKPHKARVKLMAFSGDGSRLATAGDEGVARIVDTKTGKEKARTYEFKPIPGDEVGREFHALALSHDGEVMVSDQLRPRGADVWWNAKLQFWDANTGLPTELKKDLSGPSHLAFSADGNLLLVAGDTGARILNLKTGKPTFNYGVAFPAANTSAAVFSPDGKWYASISRVGYVRAYSVDGKDVTAIGQVGDAGHSWDKPGSPECAAFSPDGKYLLTGHVSGQVVVWDSTSMRPLYGFQAHGGENKGGRADTVPTAWGVRFSPDGRRLFTATRAGEVRFWDTAAILADAVGR